MPTYIHVDSFGFKNNPNVKIVNTNGSTVTNVTQSHKVTTVWAYYNNNPIGTFDLPCTIPVVATNSGLLSLSPGIEIDALNDFLTAYPFYQMDTFSFSAMPGKVIVHEPLTEFYDYSKVTIISDFENGLERFKNWGEWTGGDISINSNPTVVYQGRSCGQIMLDSATNTNFSIDTSGSFYIAYNSNSTNPAFIELNYKNTIPFSVGIKGNLAGLVDTLTLISLYPSTTWQKVYIQVSDYANARKATSYNLFISAGLSLGVTSGSVYLDNIQLVTY